jgi:hypothetical protein
VTIRYFLPLLFLLASPLAVQAEHANITLKILKLDAASGEADELATGDADREPPAGGYTKRPLAKVKVNEPLALQFFLTNTYPHGVHKDVVVRYFVVREDKARQKELPDLKSGVVVRGQFKMNFKPKCKVGARVEFTIREPGIYLLRVDTANTQSDHEHFSAIDVQAEKE